MQTTLLPSSSSSSSSSAVDDAARQRILQSKKAAQEKLKRWQQQQQQQQQEEDRVQSRRLRQYLLSSPAAPRPPSSSADGDNDGREVIVLDGDESPPRAGRGRQVIRALTAAQRLSAAEREERRYDAEDDSAEGDVEMQTKETEQDDNGDDVVALPRHPSRPAVLAAAAKQPRVPAAASSSSTSAVPSSRQGGSDHWRHFRSSDISESSFTQRISAHSAQADSAEHAASASSSSSSAAAAASNPFMQSAPPSRAVLNSEPDLSWRTKRSSSLVHAASSSSSAAQLSGPAVVGPRFSHWDESRTEPYSSTTQQLTEQQRRQREKDEDAVWLLFDKSRRAAPVSTTTYSASERRLPGAAAAGSEGGDRKLKRSLPVGLFDSAAVRQEERMDRERRRKKKEHPLLEERRNAKRLRAVAPMSHSSASSVGHPAIAPPPPPLPPPSSSSASAAPKPSRKTQLIVDPRVAAAEKAREERAAAQLQQKLTLQRLKPSLDELHASVLSWSVKELEAGVMLQLQRRFLHVPLRFDDELQYQQVFYPLLLEECRAELTACLDELRDAMEERSGAGQRFDPRGLLEVVTVASYQQDVAFHHVDVDRVDFSSAKRSPSIFTTDDLVLLWYRPHSSDPFEPNEWETASLYTLARLERLHDKGRTEGEAEERKGKERERRKAAVRYRLQVHVDHSGGEGSEVSAQRLLSFLLKSGNQWGVVKLMSLITIHRQYRALQSCHMLSLFPAIISPQPDGRRGEARTQPVDVSAVLQPFPAALTAAYNSSQREAMATALAATDGITLIQGPPGTGKCFAAGTRLRLFSGETVAVEAVRGGEPLMGDDSQPRVVCLGSVVHDRGLMYRITPHCSGAAAFTVNGDHILVLRNSCQPSKQRRTAGSWAVRWYELDSSSNVMQQLTATFTTEADADRELRHQLSRFSPLEWEVSVDSFLATPATIAADCKLFRSGAVTFQPPADGDLRSHLSSSSVLAADATDAQCGWAAWFLGIRSCDSLCAAQQRRQRQRLLGRQLEYETLFGEIAQQSEPSIGHRVLHRYGGAAGLHLLLRDSVDVRSRFLAAVIGCIGHYDAKRAVYAIRATTRSAAAGYRLLAGSLGITTSDIGFSRDMRRHCFFLSGRLRGVLQHCATAGYEDWSEQEEDGSFGFTIRPLGLGDYHGFTVSGNNERFLLDDFTVTHNTKTIVGLINLLLLQPRAAASASSSSSSSSSAAAVTPRSSALGARILVCAPSNAAIDEVVARLLHPDALQDRRGLPLKAAVVRVGAGKRAAEKDREAVKSQHDGADVESVSLDRLVEQKLKQEGREKDRGRGGDEAEEEDGEEEGEISRSAAAAAAADQKDAAYYEREISRVKEELDAVHALLLGLEERQHAAPTTDLTGSEQQTAAEDDVRQQVDAAHKRRKALLAEKRHLMQEKDTWYDRQRRRLQQSIDSRERMRQAVLDQSDIVCTTLTGAGLELFASSTAAFSCVIVDEAAQAIELQTLIPLKYDCSRCVMVGDDQQLSATVISTQAARFQYQQSLFTRLRRCDVAVQLIQIQYRMHPAIRSFPSSCFYQSRLQDAQELLTSDVVQRHIALLQPLQTMEPQDNCLDRRIAPYVLYDVAGEESRAGHTSLHNVAEAKVAVQLFALIRRGHQRMRAAASSASSSSAAAELISRVGIITPYKQQVQTLRSQFRQHFSSDASLSSSLLPLLEISTVDSFQGREKDFVIFSAVRAHAHDRQGAAGGIGFVADANRLNVALTRARQCLLLIGSARTLGKEEIWRRLIDDARRRHCCIDVRQDADAIFADPLHHGRWRQQLDPSVWVRADRLSAAMEDDIDGGSFGNSPVLRRRNSLPGTPPSVLKLGRRQSSGSGSGFKSPTKAGAAKAEEKRFRRLSAAASPKSPASPKHTLPLPPAATAPSSSSSSSAAATNGASAAASSGRSSGFIAQVERAVAARQKQAAPVSSVGTKEKEEKKASSRQGAARSSPATTPAAAPFSSLRNLDLHSLMRVSVSASGQTTAPQPSTTASSSSSPSSAKAPPPPQPVRRSASKGSSPSPPVASSLNGASRQPAPSKAASALHSASAAAGGSSLAASGRKLSAGRLRRRAGSVEEVELEKEGGSIGSLPRSDEEVTIIGAHIAAPPARVDADSARSPSASSPSSPSPFVETVRDRARRAAFPAYSCEDCEEFHALIDRGSGSSRPADCGRQQHQPQALETSCRHRYQQSALTHSAHPLR